MRCPREIWKEQNPTNHYPFQIHPVYTILKGGTRLPVSFGKLHRTFPGCGLPEKMHFRIHRQPPYDETRQESARKVVGDSGQKRYKTPKEHRSGDPIAQCWTAGSAAVKTWETATKFCSRMVAISWKACGTIKLIGRCRAAVSWRRAVEPVGSLLIVLVISIDLSAFSLVVLPLVPISLSLCILRVLKRKDMMSGNGMLKKNHAPGRKPGNMARQKSIVPSA